MQTKNWWILVLVGLGAIAGWWFLSRYRLNVEVEPKERGGIACTLEAKICPDGSGVGRVAPDCEFAACPGEEKETEEDVAKTEGQEGGSISFY